MSLPGFEEMMLPILKLAADRKEHSKNDTHDVLSVLFKVTEEERRQLQPSGKTFVFSNRIGWALTYMKKSGLLQSVRRGVYEITQEGLNVLQENPKVINIQFLKRYTAFVEFSTVKHESAFLKQPDINESISNNNPEEIIEYNYNIIKNSLAEELLEKIKECSPEFFENLVVEVLVAMGYGGSREDAGQAIGKSGDQGIDGIIKEDKLGLDTIYIQAKRWANVVSSPEIRDFAGALQGQKARKGIFITTSSFSKDAIEFTKKIENKIVLINGHELSELMIKNNVGVAMKNNYEIKKIDLDYFESE